MFQQIYQLLTFFGSLAKSKNPIFLENNQKTFVAVASQIGSFLAEKSPPIEKLVFFFAFKNKHCVDEYLNFCKN